MRLDQLTVYAALALACGTTLAVGSDDTVPAAERLDDARSRLEAARAALDAAQREYDEAVAERERVQPEVDASAPSEQAPEPVSTSFWSGWDASVELGITGSDGNSESFNFRTALDAQRLTEKMETKLGLSYKYGTQNGTQNTNRFDARARNDWLFPGSRWRTFVQGSYEYDEFQAWDHRISGFGGVGYELIRPEDQAPDMSLLARAGIGGSQTIGGPNEEFRPEALLGLDYNWNIKEGQRFFVNTELFPSLDEVGDFRWITNAGYEIVLDQESNLYLKLGLEDRYDSNPGAGAKKNDIDYYVTLGWKF